MALGLATSCARSAVPNGLGESPEAAQTQRLIDEGLRLAQENNFTAALKQYEEALKAAELVRQPRLRLHYLALIHGNISIGLRSLGRYEDALRHADMALQAASDPLNDVTLVSLAASLHAARGAALYHLGMLDEALVMFDTAGQLGDPYATLWHLNIVDARAMHEAIASGTEAEQRGDLPAALSIYSSALQKYSHWTSGVGLGALFDRAIDVALKLDPRPAVPAQARRHAVLAETAIEDGATTDDLKLAHWEFSKAVALAPWWAEIWLKLAAVAEHLRAFGAARDHLGHYLRAAPNAPDRDAVQQRIRGLQFRVAH